MRVEVEKVEKSLGRRLEELNGWLKENRPGYQVRANQSGRLQYELVAPDGIVHYRRDSFEAIESIARR